VPSGDVLIIANPTAGNGRVGWLLPWLTEDVARRGARLAVTTRAGEAEELTAEAVATGIARVVVVGGDGTLQEAVNGLAQVPSEVVLGLVPAGSGNDLARSLGLPRKPHEALNVALGREHVTIDVAEATDGHGRRRRFASAGGTGFDAQVAETMARPRAGWQRGRIGYLLSALAELRRYRNVQVRLSWQDGTRGELTAELGALLVAFANGPYYGGGMRIAPAARPDDGELELCIVGDISRLEALRQLPGLYRGAHVGHPAVRFARARTLRIEGDPAPVHLDGEPFGRLPLAVTVHPAALRIAVPGRGLHRLG
jgi:diacylglycerol kinase (ATP)